MSCRSKNRCSNVSVVFSLASTQKANELIGLPVCSNIVVGKMSQSQAIGENSRFDGTVALDSY
jgi:hypothetical protein